MFRSISVMVDSELPAMPTSRTSRDLTLGFLCFGSAFQERWSSAAWRRDADALSVLVARSSGGRSWPSMMTSSSSAMMAPPAGFAEVDAVGFDLVDQLLESVEALVCLIE